MSLPEKKIVDFIQEHHILTLAVVRDNIPYCATCYYVYKKDENSFIFTSGPETRHIRDIVESNNFYVAGAIALETRIVGKIRGIQFTGVLYPLEETEQARAKSVYLKRFPVARLIPGLHLWEVRPDFIKLTDNRLGFGKKLIWQNENSVK